MSATEIWLIVSAAMAFVSAVASFPNAPAMLAQLSHTLLGGAVGCMAVAMVLAFP